MGLESDNKQGLNFRATSNKPLKPPSNISDIVSKFAKVCKVRSIGVFNTPENPEHNTNVVYGPLLTEESSSSDNATEDSEFDKFYPQQPVEVVDKNGNVEFGHVEIGKLFDTLSSLKLAYVKLQEAHIPYDPEKIRAADGEVVSRLESLSKIKKTYKEKLLLKEVDSVSSACSSAVEIQVQERMLEKLKSEAKVKGKMVVDFRRELHELEMRNKKMAEVEIRERETESFKILNQYSYKNVVEEVGKAIHEFAKPLIALMKVSDWDLDQAANAIQGSVVYAKRSHKKYAFEAYLARSMFHGFSAEHCILDNVMKLDDPIDALIQDPQSSFAKFCRTKYLLVIHPNMEASFFGNVDHRMFVANGIHPNTPFYRAFVRMAKWVWYLQGFTAFNEPEAEIFGVKQGSSFSDAYMEVPDELKEYKALLQKSQARLNVEFMIMPGFKLAGETLIRSQVYISGG